eukprot:6473119-Amphidinium_carterae.1
MPLGNPSSPMIVPVHVHGEDDIILFKDIHLQADDWKQHTYKMRSDATTPVLCFFRHSGTLDCTIGVPVAPIEVVRMASLPSLRVCAPSSPQSSSASTLLSRGHQHDLAMSLL